MKPKEDIDNYYNEEEDYSRVPNHSDEEIEIEPLDWEDM